MPPEVLVAVAAAVGFCPVVFVQVARVAPHTNWKSFIRPPTLLDPKLRFLSSKPFVTRLALIKSEAVDLYLLVA